MAVFYCPKGEAMWEVRIGNRWYDIYSVDSEGCVLAVYDGKFRRFPVSAYDEVREKGKELVGEVAEEKPVKKVTRRVKKNE